MRIAYIFTEGRASRLDDLREGKMPSDFFYGVKECRALGHSVDVHEIDVTSGYSKRATILNILANRNLLPWRVRGELLIGILRKKIAWQDYDVVVATHSGIGFSLAMLKVLGVQIPPIVAIQCGLLNNPCSALVKLWQIFLLKRMQSVLFASSEYTGILAWHPTLQHVVAVCEFGVDIQYWTPGDSETKDPYVLSVGNDVGRDYVTLCNAAPQLDVPIKILTKRKLPDPLPANVEQLQGSWHGGGISDSALRELYRRATCVVLPLHNISQPSGQSVCLQAMACGCPVVMSDTKGLWDRENLVDGDTIFLAQCEDADSLAAVVHRVIDHDDIIREAREKALRFVQDRWTIEKFAEGIIHQCHQAIEGQKM